MNKAVKLPYANFKGQLFPIIKILLNGPCGPLETEAYVDSGATLSIFLSTIASDLGIDFRKGRLTHIMVGDGGFIPVYIHKIRVKIGTYSFVATIGFSSHLGADFNLIGQKDFFDRFIITFNRKSGIITFRRHPSYK